MLLKKISLPVLFLAGAALLLLEGFVFRILYPSGTLDIHLHDTYLILTHFHVFQALALLMCLLAGIYQVFPLVFRRILNRRAGILHFVLTLAALVFMFWPVAQQGISGTPRRYYDYSNYNRELAGYMERNIFVAILTIACFAGQLVFLLNLLISALTGKRIPKERE